MVTNTVMFDLQAAVMAASASSGNGGLTEIPEDGVSFSEVLAAQKGAAAEGETVNQTAETEVIEGETPEIEENTEFSEIISIIENADEGMKKALEMLLHTVLKAFRGAEDGQERKTDLFMLFSDGSAGLDAEGEDGELFLTGAEIMDKINFMIETEQEAGTEADAIIAEIEKIVTKLFDDDENDENTAADVFAAMFNIPAEEISLASEDVKYAAIENVSEMMAAPKQVIEEIKPEAVEKMKQLFTELKAVVTTEKNETPEAFRMNFTALRINNAAEQVKAINGSAVAETTVADDAAETVIPEIAAVGTQAEIVPQNEVAEIVTIDAPTAQSVEMQVTEAVTEKLADITGDNGTEELIMILKPENLGEVAVKLIKENGAVTVLLSAQFEEVGKLMADRAATLGNTLENRNYEVKDVQVVSPNNASEQMGLDFTNQGFSFMQNSDNGRYSNENNDYRGIEGIDEIEETESANGGTKLKEAKLWTTA